MRVQTKIAGLGMALTLLTATVTVSVFVVKQRPLRQSFEAAAGEAQKLRDELDSGLRHMMEAQLGSTAQTIWRAAEGAYKRTAPRLAHDLTIAREQLSAAGPITLATPPVTWTCVNQFTKESTTVALPRLTAGSNWLGQNTDAKTPSPVVDFVRKYCRDDCSVYQRMNDEGDMAQVCTSVLNTNGTRAIGAYIPRRMPDGSENPVLAKVLKGETYAGRAYVVKEWHQASYEPIWDAGRTKVVGMLFVGVNLRSITQDLFDSIKKITVGKSGYVAIVGTRDQQQGVYIVSKEGKRDGENIWNTKDARGIPIVQEMAKATTPHPDGTVVHYSYPWQNEGENAPRQKTAALTYYEPLDWLINVGAYEEDFLEGRKLAEASNALIFQRIGAALNQLKSGLRWGLTGALFVAVLSVLAGWLAARALTHPLRDGVVWAHRLAKGDLTCTVGRYRNDEMGELTKAMSQMVVNLRRMLGEITGHARALGANSEDMNSVSSEVSAIAGETSNQASVVASAAEQVSKSINNVATGAEELTASVKEIAKQAADASRVANQAVGMAASTNTSIAKLSDSSVEIGNTIKVIHTIAEQTNLLALNATIEAARAGEAGKGFAVVANEVKELAKQTAKATEEITHRVQAIQDDSRSAVEAIGNIGKVIEQIDHIQTSIASAVEEQAATTNEIAVNATEAARGSSEIAKNIVSVAETAQGSTQAASKSANAATELARLSAELSQAVQRFSFGEETAAEASQSRQDRRHRNLEQAGVLAH